MLSTTQTQMFEHTYLVVYEGGRVYKASINGVLIDPTKCEILPNNRVRITTNNPIFTKNKRWRWWKLFQPKHWNSFGAEFPLHA